jgi:hypothetical protein
MLNFLNQWAGIGCFVIALLVFLGIDSKIIASMMPSGKGTAFMAQPRNKLVLSLLVICGLWCSWTTYQLRQPPDIPEFDDPNQGWHIAYGGSGSNCTGSVKGEAFAKYQADYKIALACFYADPSQDVKDIHLYVGAVHDIAPGPIPMVVNYSPLSPGRYGQRNVLALLVPDNISIAQFQTVRQARLLGVKIKGMGGQADQ